VPVGLTKHRQGLTELSPFNKTLALQTVKQVENYGKKCKKSRGSRVFYCADELYMMAGLVLPENEFYEDYPQLENGVGMMRLFCTRFEEALRQRGSARERHSSIALTRKRSNGQTKSCSAGQNKITMITGILAYDHLTKILKTATEKYDTINCRIYAIRNDSFGEKITVSGLITGRDIIAQLKDKQLGSRLLIPQNMLRHGEDVFLDDVTVSELSDALEIPVRIVRQDGADLLLALLEK
jgi:NifB/MoaA-like Fe-S oxidoreductase